MNTALLVIDVQESFRHRPYFDAQALPAYLAEQNALIEGCSALGMPVIRILHSDGPETADNPVFPSPAATFAPWTACPDLMPPPLSSSTATAPWSATGLDVWLTQHGIGRLIVSGIRTEQCCETTTRHASDLGWQVDYVTEATLTFDMTQPDGSPLSAARDQGPHRDRAAGPFLHPVQRR